MNGTAESVITASLSNWNGMAVKIPRSEIQEYTRDDIKAAGVYFLFCQDDNGSNSVYIGESEDMLERLRQHLQDYRTGKEEFYWNAVVAFTGHDLNKALIRYLEDKLVKDAKECGRYKVLTKNTYGRTVMKESQEAAMAEFMDNVKLIIATMSYNVFVPVPRAENNTTYLYCKGAGANAKGFVSNGGFTVLKGSVVSDHIVPSFIERGKAYYNQRMKLENDGVISERVFQRDYEFSAPSAASAVILGHTSNGNMDWKSEDGVKLRDI
ncbi:MAG: GIY-YIG nuclease family protein [Synergistaceae bacterium]|nr:GIY-YIG nuclease family protein [Synergistaceae bacterium]MBR0251432.1 GIY-YIG nuclease family protein [Synergistaceae bacterium]